MGRRTTGEQEITVSRRVVRVLQNDKKWNISEGKVPAKREAEKINKKVPRPRPEKSGGGDKRTQSKAEKEGGGKAVTEKKKGKGPTHYGKKGR